MRIFPLALLLPLTLFCPAQEFVKQPKKITKKSKAQLQEDMLTAVADTMRLLLDLDEFAAQGAQETAAAKKEAFSVAVDILNQEYGKSKSLQELASVSDEFAQIKEQSQMLVLDEKRLLARKKNLITALQKLGNQYI